MTGRLTGDRKSDVLTTEPPNHNCDYFIYDTSVTETGLDTAVIIYMQLDASFVCCRHSRLFVELLKVVLWCANDSKKC